MRDHRGCIIIRQCFSEIFTDPSQETRALLALLEDHGVEQRVLTQARLLGLRDFVLEA